MFADPDFADFSQEIGLASLGASDADIKRLATCYWHSVEFGLVRQRSSFADANCTDDATATTVKAYGAGLLSSFGELEHGCKEGYFPVLTTTLENNNSTQSEKTTEKFSYNNSDYHGGKDGNSNNKASLQKRSDGSIKPTLLPWDPAVACTTDYPITTYQPLYFVAESLADAKLKMRDYCEKMAKPFHARYNPLTNSIWVDRAVRTVR